MNPDSQARSRFVMTVFALWLGAAVVLALVVPIPRVSLPVRMPIIFGPVLAFAIALGSSSTVGAIATALDPRRLVALHGLRLVVGTGFLFLGQAGQLPIEFARHAGIGDVLAGAGAIALVLGWRSLSDSWGRRILFAWNLLGLIDFLNVQRVVISLRGREQEFLAMDHLPLSLVPYIVLPMLFAIHVLLFWRLLREHGTTRMFEPA